MRVYKSTSNLKHQYAFNEYGNVVHIRDAKKLYEGKEMKYYLFSDKSYELLLRASEDHNKNQKHFSVKTEFVEHNGKKFRRDTVSESIEHHNAKFRIINQGYFAWDEYKIPFKNPRIEQRFSNSMFRADLVVELMSGERVFIEIIKTSDTSKSKENYIIKNQLPTFKIYIKENGDFIYDKFDFIGNEEIERIRTGYRARRAYFDEMQSSVRSGWSKYYKEKKGIDSEIRELEERLRSKIESEERRLHNLYPDGKPSTGDITPELGEEERRIIKYREKIFSVIGRIRATRDRIQKFKKSIQQSEGGIDEIQRMESLFIQASESIEWKWVEPNYTREPQGRDRLLRLKYLLT